MKKLQDFNQYVHKTLQNKQYFSVTFVLTQK
jgi:hypothetical protein